MLRNCRGGRRRSVFEFFNEINVGVEGCVGDVGHVTGFSLLRPRRVLLERAKSEVRLESAESVCDNLMLSISPRFGAAPGAQLIFDHGAAMRPGPAKKSCFFLPPHPNGFSEHPNGFF
jgi:hypothetical protein